MHLTVQNLEDFYAPRGNNVWLEADPRAKLPAIYEAYDYITATYAVDGFETDPRVEKAIMLLAPEMLAGTLRVRAADPVVISTEDGVGDGAYLEKRTYAKPTSDDPYPLITAILAAFGKRGSRSSGNGLRIIRVTRG